LNLNYGVENMSNTTTKTDRLLSALLNGEELTSAQIRARFGITHPPSVVRNLRFSGYAIYLNEKRNSRGKTVARYRFGNASKRIIGAGYRAIAAGMA
jgi:predicted transcriptional regulator